MAIKKQAYFAHKPPYEETALSPDQIREARIIADLRITHSMVSQLYHHTRDLTERYSEQDVIRYADQELLTLDIQRNDDTYQFFISLSEKRRMLG